jgi:hypothetical protein
MFSWWKKRREAKNASKFLGVRLDRNHYLGYTKISYTGDTKEPIYTCNIHFFVDKNDFTKRRYEYECENENQFYYHCWMINAKLWKLNERELYRPIRDFPSTWLKKYMLDEYNCVWSDDKKWWIDNLEDKIESKDDNIIKVNF